jgi:hypothetical protein
MLPTPPDDPRTSAPEGPLLRLRATCPRCGAPPAVRITGAVREALAASEPERRIATVQCQRRGCATVYDVTAAACRDAR